jgi:hypothetical protein
MKTEQLRIGNEPNQLMLKVVDLEMRPIVMFDGGLPFGATLIKIRYHLDDVLIQLIEDYGEEAIMTRINELK